MNSSALLCEQGKALLGFTKGKEYFEHQSDYWLHKKEPLSKNKMTFCFIDNDI